MGNKGNQSRNDRTEDREGRNATTTILTDVSGPVVQVSPTCSGKMFKDPDECSTPDTRKALRVTSTLDVEDG